MAAPRTLDLRAFVAQERQAARKHEWIGGRVLDVKAMTGGSREHIGIGTNLTSSLHTRLGTGDCEVYNSDLGIALIEQDAYVYPDATVVCGEPAYWDEGPSDIVTNPTAVYEVLSPSSMKYDMGEKRDHYAATTSVREIVLIHPDAARIDRYVRFDRGWRWEATVGLGASLRTVGVEIPLVEIYAGIDFPGPENPPIRKI